MRLTIVGLGPGPAAWLTDAARVCLSQPRARVFVRTRWHPAVEDVLRDVAFESLDDVYDSAPSFEALPQAIAQRLLSTGEDAVLGVPGDGVLGETVLAPLLERGVEVRVVPGIPVGVGALAAAGVSAGDGLQSLESTSLDAIELNPLWPAVITGVFSPSIAGEVKLALLRVYPAEHAVRIVSHPGLADQHLEARALADLDRGSIQWDHLTHVVLPALSPAAPTGSGHSLRAIVARLRAPEIGCPWDLEQTHQTLIPYVIEEAYEVVDAIRDGQPGELADELGDLLLQVALHAEIADQSAEFDWNDVVRAIADKLVRRHPHVFSDWHVTGASDVVRNWDQLKAREREHQPPPASALDGVPRSLPALKRAAELARKARKAGFDWPTRDGTLAKVREELAELLAAETLAERTEEIGDLLYVLAKLAGQDGIDPEEALRAANAKFTRRFVVLEQIARERGWADLHSHPLAELESAWAEAKRRTVRD